MMADYSMAVYHLKVSVGSRAGGQSASAKSEYIEREGRYAADGEEREHVAHGHMPAWAEQEPRTYWAAADDNERANGRVYREVQFALPRELDADQRREVAERFAAQLTGEERLPYTLALHRGGPEGENPHAHLMISERASGSSAQRLPGAGRREEIPGGHAQGLAGADPPGVGGDGESGAGPGGPGRADRRAQPGRPARRRPPGRHLERAAALSRVHLGPQGLKGVSGEAPSRSSRLAQADDVDQRNDRLAQDRAAADQQSRPSRPRSSRARGSAERMIRELMEPFRRSRSGRAGAARIGAPLDARHETLKQAGTR